MCVCVEGVGGPLASESSSTCCSWDMSAGCSPLPGFLGLQGHSREGIRLILVAVWLHVHESVVPGTESQQDDLIFVVVFIVVFSSDESEAGFKLFASSVYTRLT